MLLIELSAEREGFEPPVPLGTTVFKTVVIDHSTISPSARLFQKAGAKLVIIFEICKFSGYFLRFRVNIRTFAP